VKVITSSEIPVLYDSLKQAHIDYLAQYGVVLPRLYRGSTFTKDAIVLCILYKYQSTAISKKELTSMLSTFFQDVVDIQQARHLARQKGWYILSGSRGDIPKIKSSHYMLYSIQEPYPHIPNHRKATITDFDTLKKKYKHRCATCGSKENQPNLINKSRITKLQKGHMDPNKPLESNNIIPQCSECNQSYRDWFIFDSNGRVSDINRNSSRWKVNAKDIAVECIVENPSTDYWVFTEKEFNNFCSKILGSMRTSERE